MVEAIEMYADDMIYVVRTLNDYNHLLNEDSESTYDEAYEIPVYPVAPNGFTGGGVVMSFSGYNINDEMTFTITKRHFEQEVTKANSSISRPREGDLIFLPMHGRCFRISYVDRYNVFFQLGTLITWEVKASLIEITNETFATGYPAIDALNSRSTKIPSSKINSGTANVAIEDGRLIVATDTSVIGDVDFGADNDHIEELSDEVLWSETNPFSESRLK